MIKTIGILFSLTVFLYLGVSHLYARAEQQLEGFIPHPEGQARVEKQLPPEQEGGEAAPPQSSYGVIVSRNIFQASLEATAPVEENPVSDLENLEETSLSLELLGTVSGSDKDARAIIIDERSKKQDLYHVGDSVQNARITQIERGKVVLEYNGRREILLIKERKGGGRSLASSAMTIPNDLPDLEPAQTRPAAPVVRPRRRISFRQPPQDIEGQDQENDALEIPEEDTENLDGPESLEENTFEPPGGESQDSDFSEENAELPPEDLLQQGE